MAEHFAFFGRYALREKFLSEPFSLGGERRGRVRAERDDSGLPKLGYRTLTVLLALLMG
jgi:hypothetical protein